MDVNEFFAQKRREQAELDRKHDEYWGEAWANAALFDKEDTIYVYPMEEITDIQNRKRKPVNTLAVTIGVLTITGIVFYVFELLGIF